MSSSRKSGSNKPDATEKAPHEGANPRVEVLDCDIPAEIPVIPLASTVVFPQMVVNLQVVRKKNLNLIRDLDPEAILGQIQRLVKPGGRVIVTFPNDPLVNRLKAVIRRTGLTLLPPFRRIAWGGDDYHLHVWTVREMRKLLSRYFAVTSARFAPNRLLPVRCCFACNRAS